MKNSSKKRRGNRWREWLKRLLAPASLVVLAALIATLGPVAPGPAWFYALAAVLVLVAIVLMHRGMTRVVFGLLGTIFPPLGWALRYERRRLEFSEVLDRMNRVLANFGLRTLETAELEAMGSSPPEEEKDDLVTCCQRFEEKLYGAEGPAMANLLELLYRDTYDLRTAGVWHRVTRAQRRELARILANGEELQALESGERLTALVGWALDRIRDDFSVRLVGKEIRSFMRLWLHLAGYAGYLRAAGIDADPTIEQLMKRIDKALPKGLLSSNFERIAEQKLADSSRHWVREWAEEREIGEPQGTRLAIVGLGIYSAECAMNGMPPLNRLGTQVARDPGARDMLLAHLWRKSRPEQQSVGQPGFAALAASWRGWRDEAEAVMGPGVTQEVLEVLSSDLMQRKWPTWLPIQQTVAEIVQQSRRSCGQLEILLKAQKKDQAWQGRMLELLDWAKGREARMELEALPEQEGPALDPDALAETVADAVRARLGDMVPPGEATRPESVEDLAEDLESFAGAFPPGTRLPSYMGGYKDVFDTLALFRERSNELARKLDDLCGLLQGEASGGSAYLITFGQTRGELADEIDALAADYDFKRYTPYARQGLLPRDESYEDFTRRFFTDLQNRLDRSLSPAAGTPPEEWENIEVTMQRISLLDRHDFVTDAGEHLKERIPDEDVFRKIFRVPPSSEALSASHAA